MYSFIPFLIVIFIIFLILRLIFLFKDKLKFYTTGLDSGFKIKEIHLLWKLGIVSNMESPITLYWSLPALDRCISQIIADSKRKGTSNFQSTQDFLSRLYQYRTKIELNPRNKKGVQSTKSLDSGQKLRIVLKGVGVFTSKIVNVSLRDLVISLPLKDGKIILSGLDWVGKRISVYLWRKKDAAYVFDTIVQDSNMFSSQSVLHLVHSNELIRTQKRKSVRCECHLYAQMYIIKSDSSDLYSVETEPGLKCLLEDISEDGALIRIGGKCVANLLLKIQFTVGDAFVVMSGYVRGVDYDKEKNQSLLHFQGTSIDGRMKNAVLSYVYNVLPQDEKDVFDAIKLTEEDAAETDSTSSLDDQLDVSMENEQKDTEDNPQG